MELYDHHHHGEAHATCRHCHAPCRLLAVLTPVVVLRRGYQGQRRYVLRCERCKSAVVLMQARTSTALYRVNH